jgi:ISXO2-like transposase domain
MTSSSRQFIRAKISRAKFRQLLRLFALDLTAVQITALTALNRNTVNRYLRLIRQAVAAHCERESPFSGDVELDESYFGARRVRGKRGRGARGKTIVFGIYKRNGRVYTEIVPNCKKASIQAIMDAIAKKFGGSFIYEGGWGWQIPDSTTYDQVVSAFKDSGFTYFPGVNFKDHPKGNDYEGKIEGNWYHVNVSRKWDWFGAIEIFSSFSKYQPYSQKHLSDYLAGTADKWERLPCPPR